MNSMFVQHNAMPVVMMLSFLLVNLAPWRGNVRESIRPDMIRGNGNAANGIYDPKGKKIKITFNEDHTLAFSANSTADIIALANGLAKTDIGANTLRLMDASKIKITIQIDKATIITRSDGTISAAETYPIISTPVNSFGKQIGTKYISKAKIIIYEATIKDMLAKHNGMISINGAAIDGKQYSLTDIISSFLIHEFTHVLDSKSSGALNPMATKSQIEKKPYESQLRYFKELEKKA